MEGALVQNTNTVKILGFVSSNKEDKPLRQVCLICPGNQSKINASTKFGNILISEKVKIVV